MVGGDVLHRVSVMVAHHGGCMREYHRAQTQ